MQALEDKIRSLEQFLRARRNQRRGHYGRVMGLGDMSAYGERHSSPFGVDGFARGEIPSRSPLMITYETPQPRAGRATLPGSTNKRQRLPHKELTPAELAAMEVGGGPFWMRFDFVLMRTMHVVLETRAGRRMWDVRALWADDGALFCGWNGDVPWCMVGRCEGWSAYVGC